MCKGQVLEHSEGVAGDQLDVKPGRLIRIPTVMTLDSTHLLLKCLQLCRHFALAQTLSRSHPMPLAHQVPHCSRWLGLLPLCLEVEED